MTGWKCTSTNKSFVATLHGPGREETKDYSILFIDEVMNDEPASKVTSAVVVISGRDPKVAAPAGD